MENPFIITGYIKPEYFCDRKQEAKRIITKITNGENIVIMAARRVGKSKLIDTGCAKNIYGNRNKIILYSRRIQAIDSKG